MSVIADLTSTLAPNLWVLAILAAMLAAIVIGGRAMRSAGMFRSRGAGRLAIIETLSLDRQRRLVLVRCDERVVLVLAGQTDHLVEWPAEVVS